MESCREAASVRFQLMFVVSSRYRPGKLLAPSPFAGKRGLKGFETSSRSCLDDGGMVVAKESLIEREWEREHPLFIYCPATPNLSLHVLYRISACMVSSHLEGERERERCVLSSCTIPMCFRLCFICFHCDL